MLNATLKRWLRQSPSQPDVDCVGCAKALKCCDFQPYWANFLVGRNERVELPQLKNGFWGPMGLVPHQSYRLRRNAAPAGHRHVDLACDFFDIEQRVCAVWQMRPGECSSYFCDLAQGSTPRQKFSQSAYDLEVAVAQMALVHVGFSFRELSLAVDELNAGERLSESRDWLEIYKATWKYASQLSAQDVAGFYDFNRSAAK